MLRIRLTLNPQKCGAVAFLLSAGLILGFRTHTFAEDSSSGQKTADNGESPKPLPDHVVAAWRNAGALVGWQGRYGHFRVARLTEWRLPGEIPAFHFARWPRGVAKKLPAPRSPFGLELGVTRMSQVTFNELASLKYLQALCLDDTKVTDVQLKGLDRLKNLRHLSLAFTKVTDAGLEELAGLKRLQTLNLAYTKVNGSGLNELARLEKLHNLFMWGTQVSDAGLKEFEGLKNLRVLNLIRTKVGDAGLRKLAAGLEKLEHLNLYKTPMTDAGLKDVGGMKNLQALRLSCAHVTDSGLKHLVELKNLWWLDLGDSPVSREGISELQKALPNCGITWYEP